MIGDMFFPDIKREKRACDDDDISRDGKILTRSAASRSEVDAPRVLTTRRPVQSTAATKPS
jgi:hypothetical protein